jgi:hypothetical protein
MTEIVFVFPTADSPGYLRRQRAAVALQNDLASNPTVETIDRLVEFLLQFAKEPDREAAREAIWDLPQARFTEVLKAIADSATPPKP